jgi:uncharacterized damage-inducible protein DinB
MNPILKPLRSVLSFNTRLFFNSLKEISEDNAVYRVSPNTNNISFIALHVLDARYFLAKYIGIDIENPYEKYKDVNTIDDIMVFPPIDTMMIHWNDVSEQVLRGIENLSSEDLAQKSSAKFPIGDNSKLGGINFLIHHETYHIGQLAYLRKYLGYTALSFN